MTEPQAAPEPVGLTPEAVVAANIRAIRTHLGLKQSEVGKLATSAGYPLGEQVIGFIENGKRRVNVDDLFGVAAALGVTVQHLLAPDAADEVGEAAQQYEITFVGGVTETVLAFRREVVDGWMNFYYGGEIVYSAAVGHILGIRSKKETAP